VSQVKFSILILATFLAAGCSTPLQKAVKAVAPTYNAKQPASNDASLGKRFLGAFLWKDGSIDINKCYTGENSNSSAHSWDNISIAYAGSAQGDLTADFGSTIKTSLGGTSTVSSQVTLTDNEIQELKNLVFDPQSTCLDDESFGKRYSDGGADDDVIVRAVMGKTISITSKDSNTAKLVANATPVSSGGVGGSLDASMSSATTSVFNGTKLYYAQEVKTYHTTVERQIKKNIPVRGNTTSIGSCSFTLIGVDDVMHKWSGELNCVGDTAPEPLESGFNGYKGRIKNGVTHSIKVSQAGPGFYDVEMNKITVRDKQ